MTLTLEEAETVLADARADEAVTAWAELLGTLVDEVGALDRAGIPTLLLGDLALALTMTGPGDGDAPESLDLLVPTEQAARAAAVLAERGWAPVGGVALEDLLLARHTARFELAVIRPDRDVPPLNLYWHLLADHLVAETDAERLARGVRRAVSASGGVPVEVQVAAPVDLLLAAAAGAAACPHPPPGADEAVATLLASGQVDGEALAAAARRSGVGCAVAAALDRLPTEPAAVPVPVRDALQADRPRGARGWYARHRVRPTWGAVDAPGRFVARHLGIVSRGRPVIAVRSLPAHVRLARAPEVGRRLTKGQAMNGQVGRRLVVRRLAAAVPVEVAFETGTNLGHSTPFLARVLGCEVWTAEIDPASAERVRRRFAHSPALHVREGDSPAVLAELVDRFGPGRPFFYLDAHWRDHLPLWDELAVVFAHADDPIVMIDDFAVPGDPGYGYDDYGPGHVLDIEHLRPHVPEGFTWWFPALPASVETGARRGCVLIAREEHAAALEGCLLRR